MPEITLSLGSNLFAYKDVNHVIRYCKKLDYIIENIELGGFRPSYCEEKFNNEIVLIPMVSFCNIPIRDVENYMYYGDYGLGFTMDWAIKNKLSPIIYVHENSDFLNLQNISIKSIPLAISEVVLNEVVKNSFRSFTENDSIYFFTKFVTNLNRSNVRYSQFTKFWKNEVFFKITHEVFEGELPNEPIIINSYNEREWRYVPFLDNQDFDEIIYQKKVGEDKVNPKYTKFKDNTKKPHFTEEKHMLKFDLDDLKYIIVKSASEIVEITKVLSEKYDENEVQDRLSKGHLYVLSKDSIKNDF